MSENKTRRTLIAGNWKMNKTPREAEDLMRELIPLIREKGEPDCDVVVCPPAVDIPVVGQILAETKSVIALGAQNVHFRESGAFTGEISAPQLTELKVKYVIVGHSERRAMFGDTD